MNAFVHLNTWNRFSISDQPPLIPPQKTFAVLVGNDSARSLAWWAGYATVHPISFMVEFVLLLSVGQLGFYEGAIRYFIRPAVRPRDNAAPGVGVRTGLSPFFSVPFTP